MATRSTAVLEVLDGGLLTTVQDDGRRGHEAEGVPRAGAADAIGLAVANLLLGNEPDAAGLEVTVTGLRVRALVDVDLAIGGADLGAVVEPGPEAGAATLAGEPVPPGTSVRLAAGSVLAVTGAADPDAPGCRTYLAVPGGIDVPVVLDSRSTCLPAGFGGLEGRAVRAGDRLAASRGGMAAQPAPRRLGAQVAAGLPSPAQRLRVLPGPASGEGDPAFGGLVERTWLVSSTSDRRGLRLEPADPTAGQARGEDRTGLAPLAAGELPSLGVIPGAVQVTPSGQPLVLMPDSGTTGGYPVVAVVIQADVPLLGQLAPGAEVRFRATTPAAAREAAIERRALIASIGAALS